MNKINIFDKVLEYALGEVSQLKMLYDTIDDIDIKNQLLKIIENYLILVNIIKGTSENEK